MNKDLRIVYMGTPEFAVAGLSALVENGYKIVAVVTMPDKPMGRGHKVQYSAVKEYALSVGLPVLQPEKLKDETFIAELRSYKADLQVVTAFRMLPEAVWSMPRLGTFNVHASLLPQYRGAAPINWAIINGEKETGLTTFMLKHDIDTGDMIRQERTEIGMDEDAGSVHDRLMEMSKETVLRTIEYISECDEKGIRIKTTPQPSTGELKPAPKIFKETCQIDFGKRGEEIRNFVRGLSPYPAAWADIEIGGQRYENVKIYKISAYKKDEAVNNHKHPICIECADGIVSIDELQLAGKKRMDAVSLMNGLR